MPLNAAIQRIQRLMRFNGVLTDGAGGSAQTDLSNLVGLSVYAHPRTSEDAARVGCTIPMLVWSVRGSGPDKIR
eukprot:scaffold47487_cov58-Phaeocystis_antarctica.AAC.1